MKFAFLILACFLSVKSFATQNNDADFKVNTANYNFIEFQMAAGEMPCPIFFKFHKKQRLNKRITAAVLAFPFPFGMVGLHRIYLGTKPFVPIAYIASLGGGFGILPLIDFFAITFDKDFDHYKDNGKVFMWIKE
jgi:TM2 domain-containing membrane protein YozV